MNRRLPLLLLLLCLAGGRAAADGAWESEAWVAEAYAASHRLEGEGRPAEAARALEPVVAAYPWGYAVNLRLGWLHYRGADYAASERCYAAALKAAPDAIEARLGLLLPLMARGEWSRVEQGAYRILQEDPLNYLATLRLLTALLAQERYALAESQAQRMVLRYPADPALLRLWAEALEGNGEAQRAAALRADIAVLDPRPVPIVTPAPMATQAPIATQAP